MDKLMPPEQINLEESNLVDALPKQAYLQTDRMNDSTDCGSVTVLCINFRMLITFSGCQWNINIIDILYFTYLSALIGIFSYSQ